LNTKLQIHLTWFVKVYLLPLIGSNEVMNAFKSWIEYHVVDTKLITVEKIEKWIFKKCQGCLFRRREDFNGGWYWLDVLVGVEDKSFHRREREHFSIFSFLFYMSLIKITIYSFSLISIYNVFFVIYLVNYVINLS